ATLHQLGHPVEDLTAVERRQRGPAALGGAGVGNRIAHILAGSACRPAERLPVCAGHLVGTTRLAAWERSADEQLCRALDRDAVAHRPFPSKTTYGSRPCSPPSRPKPLSLYPPKGDEGSNRLNVFAQTTPARRRWAIQRMRDPFSVQTPAESPYGVLFAFSTASSGVRNVRIDRTGPKISSRAIRCDWETPVNSVGRNQKPRSGRRHAGWYISAPSSIPLST